MFTGIIESVGVISELKKEGTNLHIKVRSEISHELRIDQSVSHNGVCLTVTGVEEGHHWVTAVDETLRRSNLDKVGPGDELNLERCMKADGRFDGHIVQGHVDTIAEVLHVEDADGSWLFTFRHRPSEEVLVEKGSVCINGVSLTCFNIEYDKFNVAIIPYTFENTNFRKLKEGDLVNIEFDIVGKYIKRILNKN